MAAMFAALWASLLAYVAVNGLSLLTKIVPVALLVVFVLLEWFTSSVWTRLGFVAIAVAAVVAYLDLAGKLPVLPVPVTPVSPAPTPTPTPPPKPAK